MDGKITMKQGAIEAARTEMNVGMALQSPEWVRSRGCSPLYSLCPRPRAQTLSYL